MLVSGHHPDDPVGKIGLLGRGDRERQERPGLAGLDLALVGTDRRPRAELVLILDVDRNGVLVVRSSGLAAGTIGLSRDGLQGVLLEEAAV